MLNFYRKTFLPLFLSLLALAVLPAALFSESRAETLVSLVRDGGYKELKKALIKNQSILNNKFGEKGDSLLMTAIESGREADIIGLLLDAGVNPKAKNSEGDTAAIYAVRCGASEEILDKILRYGTVLNFQRRNRILYQNEAGESAYSLARQGKKSGYMDVFSRYIDEPLLPDDNSAVPENAAKEPTPAAQEAAPDENASGESLDKSEQDASVALNEGSGENAVPQDEAGSGAENEQSSDSAPAPIAAIDNSALEKAARDAEITKANPYRRTYLFEGIEVFDTYRGAIEDDGSRIIENPDKKGKNGRTLLHKAASEDDLVMIKNLVNSRAAVNLTDNDGWSALMYAARFAKKAETVKMLLEAGADVQAVNNYGLTALEIAAAHNTNPDIIERLFGGAKKATRQKAFISAVGLGQKNEVISRFIELGLNVNQFYKGKTPLMYAAESNTGTECISLLLEKGADKKMLSSDYKDAYYYASLNPNLPHNEVYWSLNNGKREGM